MALEAQWVRICQCGSAGSTPCLGSIPHALGATEPVGRGTETRASRACALQEGPLPPLPQCEVCALQLQGESAPTTTLEKARNST